MFGVTSVPKADVSYLDARLLDGDGRLQLLPAASYRDIDRGHLMLWCHEKARYLLPTQELVAWLKEKIAGRPALEIGSGNGDLAYHLGIRGTDSYCQTRIPWIAKGYELIRAPVTRPRPDIEEIDALAAVEKYKPEVVVGAWCTERGDKVGSTCAVGVREQDLIKAVPCYIHIGNELVHGQKSSLFSVSDIRRPGWIVSRSRAPSADVIYVWERT